MPLYSGGGSAGGGGIASKFCQVTRSTNQALVANTVTPASFDTKVTDNNAMIDIAGHPTRITIQTAGTYYTFGMATIQQAAGATTPLILKTWIRKNGATLLGNAMLYDSEAAGTNRQFLWASTVSALLTLAQGDYLELMLLENDNAAAGGTSLSADGNPIFAAFQVA